MGDRISAEIQGRNVAAATKMTDEALPKDPKHIYLQWLRATVTTVLVDPEHGREELEKVLRKHPCPDRARPSYRARERAVARPAAVPLADDWQRFLAGREPEAARKPYHDWRHPTADGHQVIARQLAPLDPSLEPASARANS